jgi:hypothetical protein
MTTDMKAQWVEALGLLALLGMGFAGVVFFGVAVVGWLRAGQWDPASMLDAVEWAGDGSGLDEWVGLRRLLGAVPFYGFLLFGGAIGVVAGWLDQR